MKRFGMSERQYAAYAGITRGAVSKARLSGRLVLHPDGSIDAAASDAPPVNQPGQPAPSRATGTARYMPVPEGAVAAVTLKSRDCRYHRRTA